MPGGDCAIHGKEATRTASSQPQVPLYVYRREGQERELDARPDPRPARPPRHRRRLPDPARPARRPSRRRRSSARGVADALGTLSSADPTWLWLAGIGFAISVLAAAGSWRCAIGLCGGRLSRHRRLRALRGRLARQHPRPLPRRRRRPDRALLPRPPDREAPLDDRRRLRRPRRRARGRARRARRRRLRRRRRAALAAPDRRRARRGSPSASRSPPARAARTSSTPSARSPASRAAPPASSPGSRSRPAAASSPRPPSAPRSTCPTRSPRRS